MGIIVFFDRLCTSSFKAALLRTAQSLLSTAESMRTTVFFGGPPKRYVFVTLVFVLTLNLFSTTQALVEKGEAEGIQSQEQKKREECLKQERGIRKIITQTNGDIAVNFECSGSKEDYCSFSASGAEKIIGCWNDPTKSKDEQLQAWVRAKSSDIATRIQEDIGGDKRMYFKDQYGILSPPTAFEPPLEPGNERLIEMTSKGVAEAFSGLYERVESFGREGLKASLTLDELGNMGFDRTIRPMPNNPPPASGSGTGEIITFRQYGDSGLSVVHTMPFNAAPGRETKLENYGLYAEPIYTEGVRRMFRTDTTFEPVPLLEGQQPSWFAGPQEYVEGDAGFRPLPPEQNTSGGSIFHRGFNYARNGLRSVWNTISGYVW